MPGRRRSRRWWASLCALAALAAYAPASATPEPPTPTGQVVFARDNALWRVPVDGSGEPTKLADLPPGAREVRAITSSANGGMLVLDVDGVAAWVQPGTDGEVRRVASSRCRGPGRPAPDGSELVCRGEDAVVVQPIAWRSRELELAADDVHYLGTTEALLVAGDNELRAVEAAAPERSRTVAPHRPAEGLLVAPNGERAIGRYQRAGQTVVLAFRLDGTAAQRKLGGNLHPVAWSPDSQWVLFAHERRACLARAVGGEYKCWERYRALAFSPDSRFVLLARRGAIYRAPIDGVEPARPKRVVDADGPAAWLP